MQARRFRRYRKYLAVLAVALLAGAAARAEDGLYLGVEAGFANAADIESAISGVNHPTRCDFLLYPAGIAPPDDAACLDATPELLFSNSFEADDRSATALSLGWTLGQWRFEAEYLARHHGGETQTFRAAGGNAALVGKDTEWATPPRERIADFRARQLFANVYYDFPVDSSWTLYVGAGAGWASTRLDYSVEFVRKPEAEYLAISFDPDWPEEAKRAAAGTLSSVNTEIDEDLFGYQLLAGADYSLTERTSLTFKARWARFEEMTDDKTWDLIRSHAAVLADGSDFTTEFEFDNIEYWAVTAGLKYRF